MKTEERYRIRLLPVQRRNLERKLLDLENPIRHPLKVLGIRLGQVGRRLMEKALRDERRCRFLAISGVGPVTALTFKMRYR